MLLQAQCFQRGSTMNQPNRSHVENTSFSPAARSRNANHTLPSRQCKGMKAVLSSGPTKDRFLGVGPTCWGALNSHVDQRQNLECLHTNGKGGAATKHVPAGKPQNKVEKPSKQVVLERLPRHICMATEVSWQSTLSPFFA